MDMMQIFDLAKIPIQEILDRNEMEQADVTAVVKEIIQKVRTEGDAALYFYNEKFDHVVLENLLVSEAETQEALTQTDNYFLETLRQAAENIASYHKRQLKEGYIINEKNGVILGQKMTPIAKVGLYVPGGTAAYPSSVLMNAVPAKLAGVEELVMVTPPGKDGKIPSVILAAAYIAGVSKIVKCGGAQAIAALAYGTESVPKVDKIVGPGNLFVATAKQMVYGMVDIDMVAGPSEILVVADTTSNPVHVAADLLSQAEHDKMASAVLVTDSEKLAKNVQQEVEKQLQTLPREEIARCSIENRGKIILASNIMEAIDTANAIAPEHLELCVDDPFALLSAVKNAGSIFLGKYTPEPMGDYFAGTNHVLPTGGRARFSSPLSVDDFRKKSSFLYYTKDALEQVKDRVSDFALREGLDAHSRSIMIRFAEEEKGE